jgi:hypothetical protein
LNQTGNGQKFAPPQKGSQTKDTCRNAKNKTNVPFPHCPQFQCCAVRVFAGANFCPENARVHGSQKQATLKLGEGGENNLSKTARQSRKSGANFRPIPVTKIVVVCEMKRKKSISVSHSVRTELSKSKSSLDARVCQSTPTNMKQGFFNQPRANKCSYS